jgi:glycosyltransferase involved in cell wall biosynthesis
MMKVTTVIPVRNRAKFIERALDSVAAQTFPSAEIVVVNDASTDDTLSIVHEAAKRIPNLIIIDLEKNVGAAEARNIGVRSATYDLIAFLDSDDIWYPEKTAKQVEAFLSDPKAVAIFTGSRVIYPDRIFSHVPAPVVTLTDLYYSNKLSTTSSAMVTRESFGKVGGFDASLPSCEDWDLFLRLAEVGNIRTVQEDLIEFLNHEGDRLSRNKAGILSGHDMVQNRIYERITDPAVLRRVRGSHHCTLADIFSSLIYEPRRAVAHAVQGIALAPTAQSFRILARVMKRIVLQ